MTVVGAWKTCFRPARATVTAGNVIQWQDADARGQGVVFDNGTDLGQVRHVLEVRFNRPGTYRYHGLGESRPTGTIIVAGTRVPGPDFEVVK